MLLLGAKNYDPGTAVSKSTATATAMTAIDTTNLRLAVTIPASGIIRVRMGCPMKGATGLPSILFGVLNGSTVVGRVCPIGTTQTTGGVSPQIAYIADFMVTGLTPGAMNLDAAYAVQLAIASTSLQYGGPDNTSGPNAWGGFIFEIYDPQAVNVMQWNGTAVPTPATAGVPDVNVKNINNVSTSSVTTVNANQGTTQPIGFTGTGLTAYAKVDAVDWAGAAITASSLPVGTAAGASGGLLIAGSNAATTFADLTVTGTFLMNYFTVSLNTTLNAFIISGNTTFTGSIAALNASNDIRGIKLASAQTFDNTGTWTGNIVGTLSTLTTYTGNTPQTGDSFALIGATGSGLTSLAPAATALSTATWTSLRAGYLDNLSAGAVAQAATALSTANWTNLRASYLDNLAAGPVALAASALSGAVWTNARAAYLDNLSAGAVAPASTALSTANWTTALAGALTTLASHDPGGTLATNALLASVSSNVLLVPTQITTDHGIGSYVRNTEPDNTGIAAIKVNTDLLTFTVSGFVNCNVRAVNDITIDGAGTSANPWGPA